MTHRDIPVRMIEFVPLDALDNFLLNYHVGHVLVLLFVFAVLGTLPLSRKLFSLNLIAFGAIFLLTPSAAAPPPYKLFGIALIVLGPVLYTTFTE